MKTYVRRPDNSTELRDERGRLQRVANCRIADHAERRAVHVLGATDYGQRTRAFFGYSKKNPEPASYDAKVMLGGRYWLGKLTIHPDRHGLLFTLNT